MEWGGMEKTSWSMLSCLSAVLVSFPSWVNRLGHTEGRGQLWLDLLDSLERFSEELIHLLGIKWLW